MLLYTHFIEYLFVASQLLSPLGEKIGKPGH